MRDTNKAHGFDTILDQLAQSTINIKTKNLDPIDSNQRYKDFGFIMDNVLFEKLDEAGVLVERDLACCNSCGQIAIGELKDEMLREGCVYEGYLFYTKQDTDDILVQFKANAGKKFDVHIKFKWSIFGSENRTTDRLCQFADKIIDIVSKIEGPPIRIEYGGIGVPLHFWIPMG